MDASAPTHEQLIELATHAAQLTSRLRYEHLAAYTAFIYDWLLTVSTERELLSGSGFIPFKVSYLLCRYWPLVLHPVTLWTQLSVKNPHQCAQMFRRPLFFATFNFVGVASVLLVRLYAFNGARFLPMIPLVMALCVVVVFQLYVTAAKIAPAQVAFACFPANPGRNARWLSGFFLSALIWDVSISATFAFLALRDHIRRSSSDNVIRMFFAQGLCFFFAITLLHAANTVLSFQTDTSISGTLIPFSIILPNLCACRLVINLRRAASIASESLDMSTVPGQRDFGMAKPSLVLPFTSEGMTSILTNPFAKTGVSASLASHPDPITSWDPNSSGSKTKEMELGPMRRDRGRQETNFSTFSGVTDSLGVRTDSGTGSFTSSSFTGTAGMRSGTSSLAGPAYRSNSSRTGG